MDKTPAERELDARRKLRRERALAAGRPGDTEMAERVEKARKELRKAKLKTR